MYSEYAVKYLFICIMQPFWKVNSCFVHVLNIIGISTVDATYIQLSLHSIRTPAETKKSYLPYYSAMGGRTIYRTLSPKRAPFQTWIDCWPHLRKIPRRRWISHAYPVWLWGCSSRKISSPGPAFHGTKWLLWHPHIKSPTLHFRCRINRWLIKRGSIIDHWKSRCKGRILWPTPHTYIHTLRITALQTIFIAVNDPLRFQTFLLIWWRLHHNLNTTKINVSFLCDTRGSTFIHLSEFHLADRGRNMEWGL
jgi:hypothetical protein